MMAMEWPWFLVKGENLLVREVSVRLPLLALLEDQGQTNRRFPMQLASTSCQKNLIFSSRLKS
jgi:hypothetical protein